MEIYSYDILDNNTVPLNIIHSFVEFHSVTVSLCVSKWKALVLMLEKAPFISQKLNKIYTYKSYTLTFLIAQRAICDEYFLNETNSQ